MAIASTGSSDSAAPVSPGAEAVTGGRQPWRALYADAATFLSRGLVAGLICGLVIGGVGGRLAMFALRLTSGGALRGVETDDGFIIGSFTGATLFLVIVTGFLGAAGGLAYLGVCEWVPPRWRAAVYALLGATLGGAAVIRPEGVDFTELEPLRLAVAFFVILPAAYGAAVSLLAERLVRAPRAPGALRIVLLVLPFGLLATGGGPFGLAALALGMGASAANRAGGVARAWRSAPATWAGRAGLLGVFGLSGVALLRDVGAVL